MDTTEVTTTSDAPRKCVWCGHENIPNAQFCGRCGQALDAAPPADTNGDPAVETTGVFRPLTSTSPEATWADAEAEQTSALPVQRPAWAPPPEATDQPSSEITHTESARGLVLGIIATLLILAVVGYYFYAAWVSESIRDDITAALPW